MKSKKTTLLNIGVDEPLSKKNLTAGQIGLG